MGFPKGSVTIRAKFERSTSFTSSSSVSLSTSCAQIHRSKLGKINAIEVGALYSNEPEN